MQRLKKTLFNIVILFRTVSKFLNNLITREFLIFNSLLSFTVFLVILVADYVKALNDQVAIGGLFFTLVFSGWQFIEDRKEKNYQNTLNIEKNLNDRVDFIVTQFTKALEDIRTRSEQEDETHNNKLDLNETKIVNIINELDNAKEILNYHLHSFGHNKTIEQQQEIIKRLVHIETGLKFHTEYLELTKSNKELEATVTDLKKDFFVLQNSLKRLENK